ncbi:hypothetical protein [Streptomyces mobaraensis]|nr:hypothetical protein [Streptomyces mobaraensis]
MTAAGVIPDPAASEALRRAREAAEAADRAREAAKRAKATNGR